jgi:hypothetical protein
MEVKGSVSKGLIAVLKAMSPKRLGHFRQYLNFEPFEANVKLSELFDLINLYFLSSRPPRLDWEAAIAKEGIAASQLNKLQTYLHQKLDQFLALQQIVQQPQRYHSYTIEAYSDLKLDYATIEKKWRQVVKKLENEAQSTEYFQQLSSLEEFTIAVRISGGAKISGSFFEEMHVMIDQNYILMKLKYLCASVNEASILNQPFPNEAIDAMKAVMKSQTRALPPYGQAYWKIFCLLEDSAQPFERYQDTYEFLKRHQATLSKEDNFDLFNYLLNLSYVRLDLGEPHFLEFVVEMYDLLIEVKLLTMDGILPSRTFKNIVSLNCRLQRYGWCLQFIDAFQKHLQVEDQSLLPSYCQGLVHFYSQNHVESALIFRDIINRDPDDHLLGFESRNLLLKSYFHRFQDLTLEEYEDLHRLIDSFRMYVRRNNKLSEFHHKSYLNFVHYFNLMVRHLEEHGHSKSYPKTLHTQIKNLKFITNKKWLLDRIEEKSEA